MPRTLTFLIITIALISSTYAQTIGMPGKYMGLLGLIHTVRSESYNCSGDPAEKPWRVDEVTYDRQGNETYRAFFNADGSIGHQVSNKFNNEGVQTGWAEFYGKSDFPPTGLNKHADFTLSGGKVISVVVYKENTTEFKSTRQYDERGNMTREVTVEIGCCSTTRTFKYDAQNRVVENTYDSSGLSSVQRRTYDKAGNVSQESYFDKGILAGSITREFDGRRLLKEVSTWRGRGQRTTINSYNNAGSLVLTEIDDPSITSTTTIEYYENGKIRFKDQVTTAKAGGPPQDSEATPNPGRILEKYDNSGNRIERYIYDGNGALYLTQLSSYDEKGNPVGLVDKSSSGPMYSRDLVYEYDSHGNRVASRCRKTADSGEVNLLLAEKKIITYYDN